VPITAGSGRKRKEAKNAPCASKSHTWVGTFQPMNKGINDAKFGWTDVLCVFPSCSRCVSKLTSFLVDYLVLYAINRLYHVTTALNMSFRGRGKWVTNNTNNTHNTLFNLVFVEITSLTSYRFHHRSLSSQ